MEKGFVIVEVETDNWFVGFNRGRKTKFVERTDAQPKVFDLQEAESVQEELESEGITVAIEDYYLFIGED